MHRKYSRKISKLIAAVLVASSLLLSTTVVNATTINDFGISSTYAREAIQWMANNNIISGDKLGNFNPRKSILRTELVTLLVKVLEIDTSDLPTKATFTDVPTEHWAYKYVEAANRAGIVSGIGNGKFGINNQCSREQITTMLLNYLSVSKEAILNDQGLSEIEKFKDQSKMSEWAKPSIQFAVSNKLMSGISSDLFSPAGSATKEQIAVILYKFLNSRDIIEQKADTLRKPLVTFNGDILKLTVSAELENGEVLVPLDLFKKIGIDVTTDEQKNSIIIKSLTIAGHNIYFNTGNLTAYTNYAGSGNPFNDTSAQDNLVILNTAPRKVGNEVLVPLKAVVTAMGMKVDWNTKTNLVQIQDSMVVKNPILYNALKDTLQYKGNLSSSMSMSMKESNSNEDFSVFLTMNSAINGLNSASNSKFSVKITGMPDETLEYNTVNLADKIYSKDLETGEWSVLDSAEATDLGIMYYNVAADRVETQKLLEAYSKMNIIPEGKVTLNGEEVFKYQIKISTDILDEFMPTDIIENGLGLKDIYNMGLSYNVEIYVNSQGQLVKQSIRMSGGINVDDYNINITIAVDTIYSNIGKDIEIVSPILEP
jgi:hypothetical protein